VLIDPNTGNDIGTPFTFINPAAAIKNYYTNAQAAKNLTVDAVFYARWTSNNLASMWTLLYVNVRRNDPKDLSKGGFMCTGLLVLRKL
jgi:hypothetical protein